MEILHNYEYNSKGFVTEKETVNSNGDHVYLKYVHPGESLNFPYTAYNDDLIKANRIYPIEKMGRKGYFLHKI